MFVFCAFDWAVYDKSGLNFTPFSLIAPVLMTGCPLLHVDRSSYVRVLLIHSMFITGLVYMKRCMQSNCTSLIEVLGSEQK